VFLFAGVLADLLCREGSATTQREVFDKSELLPDGHRSGTHDPEEVTGPDSEWRWQCGGGRRYLQGVSGGV